VDKKTVIFFKKQKKEVIEFVTNEYTIYLFLSMWLCRILWNKSPNEFWNASILLIFIVHFILFTYNVSAKRKIIHRENWYNILLILLMIVYWITYTFIKVNIIISVYLLIFSTMLIFGFLLYNYFMQFVRQKKLEWIIIYYIITSTIIVITFAFIYILITAFYPSNTIVTVVQNESLKNSSDYVYFSAQTYLLSSYGEFYPQGTVMRWVTIAESTLTFVITAFIINDILSNKYRRNKSK
jgi:hypothetical protein